MTEIDFARLAPGDIGFYVEVRDMHRRYETFKSLGIWQAVREITEGDAASTQPWQRRSEQLLGMTPEQLIADVLGRRAALFAKRSDDWQNGVLIAEVESRVVVRNLLQAWRARPMSDEGAVRRYRLRGNLLCAELDRIIVIGPSDDPDGLWGRAVLLMTGRGPHLAGQSEFASLRSRYPDRADAILFARWPDDYAFAFADCERVMAAIEFDGHRTLCSIYGRRRRPEPIASTVPKSELDAIPPDTLAYWSGRLSKNAPTAPSAIAEPADPGDLLRRLFEAAPKWLTAATPLSELVGERASIRISVVETAEFQFPITNIVLASSDPETFGRQLDGLITGIANMIAVFAMPRSGEFRPIETEHLKWNGFDIRRIRVGPLIAARNEFEFLRPLEIAWTVTKSAVLISTSAESLKSQIAPSDRGAIAAGDHNGPFAGLTNDQTNTLADAGFIAGRPTAAMFRSWLDYIARHHPDANSDIWWQLWALQKLVEQSRLGVGLADDATRPGHVIVKEVESFSPAGGRLRIGDVIVAAGGESLPAKRPAQIVAQRYHMRRSATTFPLTVLREGREVTVEIPVRPSPNLGVADFKPITTLDRLSTLLNAIESAAYIRYGDDPHHLDVRIGIRWAQIESTTARTTRKTK